MRTPPALPEDAAPDTATARAVIARALAEGRRLLSEPEAKAVLAAYGVPTVPTQVASTPQEAERLAAGMLENAEAMVVKILSPDLTHKSDVGGVRLNLATAGEVRAAAEAVIAQARARRPEARIEGVVVQPMVRRPGAHELILGIGDDPTFGPVMLFGAGGTAVEVVADKALALPPLDLVLAHDLIGRASRGCSGASATTPRPTSKTSRSPSSGWRGSRPICPRCGSSTSTRCWPTRWA
jgi:acetyltransferase